MGCLGRWSLLLLGAAACAEAPALAPPSADTDEDASTSPWDACPDDLVAERGEVVNDPRLQESSGLVAGGSEDAPVLWGHNDSGYAPELFAIDPASGDVLAKVTLSNGQNVDWEDITRLADGRLVVGDVGDNLSRREHVSIWRLSEPDPSRGDHEVEAEEVRWTYADGEARDVEALLTDPSDGSLWMVSKRFDGVAGVFRADADGQGAQVVERVMSLQFGEPPLLGDRLVTGGDVSQDGRWVALRTYFHVWLWPRHDGQSLGDALSGEACGPYELATEPQGEAIAFVGERFVTHSERVGEPLWWYGWPPGSSALP